MQQDILVSVIIPVYNVEEYLARCVESVLNQTYQNLEVILVDDGAKDSSGAICDRFAEKDPRVRVIHKENGGLSSARNAGIDIATGAYLEFVDSDDWIEPDAVESLLSLALAENVELVLGGRWDVSAKTGENIFELKELLGKFNKKEPEKKLVGDIIKKGDRVLLVIPIDSAAPKGRLILPQQQTIRDILDSGAYAIAVRDSELSEYINKFGTPDLVITDSQVFNKVSKILPQEVPLTSFSILFSRYKGELWEMAAAAKTIDDLNDGDKVLIAEGCTHHRQCEDIGTVKIPRWISEKTGKKIDFEFVSGGDFPKNLEKYRLIIHCGGCTLTENEVKSRVSLAKLSQVPITNYGTMIAYLNGILERSTMPFKRIGE